jgi:hypothetical protein
MGVYKKCSAIFGGEGKFFEVVQKAQDFHLAAYAAK